MVRIAVRPEYLRSLHASVMSLYEVVDVTAGSHLVLKDLVCGGAHVTPALDEPIPMLGDVLPRAAVQNEERREKVITKLSFITNSRRKRPWASSASFPIRPPERIFAGWSRTHRSLTT
jgi:hypothetical protein